MTETSLSTYLEGKEEKFPMEELSIKKLEEVIIPEEE